MMLIDGDADNEDLEMLPLAFDVWCVLCVAADGNDLHYLWNYGGHGKQ